MLQIYKHFLFGGGLGISSLAKTPTFHGLGEVADKISHSSEVFISV